MELIDRLALREKMYHEAFESDTDMQRWDGGCWIRYKMFENAVNDAPIIEAVPVVHGKWNPGKILSHEFVGNVCVSIDFEDWRCSICGIVVEQPNMPLYKYCPNCGAKMEVRE